MTTVREYHQRNEKQVIAEEHSLPYIYHKLMVIRNLLETQKNNELAINECINVLNNTLFELGEYNYTIPSPPLIMEKK